MQIILRHRGKESWAGVVKYKNCFSTIGGYITRSGAMYTGLSPEDEERFEKALSLPTGRLSRSSDFWDNFSIKLGSKDMILNTEIPYEEMLYTYLVNHKDVANGLRNLKPNHKYVIINKESEAIELNSINKIKREAIREFDKMNLEEMRKCLRLFGFKADTMSNELVESRLFDIVEKEPRKFITKWVDNKSRNTESLIEQAIGKNIIRKNRNIYYYGTESIGRNLDEAVEFIEDKKNQDIVIAIKNEIEVK